jgi:Fic family protein
MRSTGHYLTLGETKYFIPSPLPPENPQFELSPEMAILYGEAMLQLGKLSEINSLPDMQRFIRAYVIKEALLSSSIEGIHTTLLDVFTQPLSETRPNKNTQLVLNYTSALEVAYAMIIRDGLPIITRVLLASHKELMSIGEGDNADPGNFRKQAVKVGNLIPPPAHYIWDLMSDLEAYINTDQTLPPLIKAGLAHVQFETIHPFLDGNGRIGRLLIVLILLKNNIIKAPLMYPSYYFKKNQQEYYQMLDRVRTHGDFEGWIIFYLKAIRDSSIDAYQRATEIEKLRKQLIEIINKNAQLSPSKRELRLKALTALFSYPVTSINELSNELEVSYNTAKDVLDDCIAMNIVSEISEQKRGRTFAFNQYLELLEKEY